LFDNNILSTKIGTFSVLTAAGMSAGMPVNVDLDNSNHGVLNFTFQCMFDL